MKAAEKICALAVAKAKINTRCPCGRVNHVKSTSMKTIKGKKFFTPNEAHTYSPRCFNVNNQLEAISKILTIGFDCTARGRVLTLYVVD